MVFIPKRLLGCELARRAQAGELVVCRRWCSPPCRPGEEFECETTGLRRRFLGLSHSGKAYCVGERRKGQ